MTPTALAWRRIVRRPAATALSVLLIGLGVAAIATMLLVVGQSTRAAERNAAAADLVIGAKTSAMQLVLSGVLHLDAPPAPFPAAVAEPLLRHVLVKRWVPVALGDSLDGYRLVGTRPSDFAGLYGGVPASGAWPQRRGQAILGADVARDLGLATGAGFHSTHGLSGGGEQHQDHGYEVTGVLARTGSVVDKLVLTPIESIWHAHAKPPAAGAGHDHDHDDHDHDHDHDHAQDAAAAGDGPHGQVSLILVQTRSMLGPIVLPPLFGAAGLQTAVPAQETARLLSALQIGADGTLMLGSLLLVCAALAMCAGLLATHRERMRDVAVLRLLGASRHVTAQVLALEASFVGLLGAGGGLLVAHLAVELMSRHLPSAAPPLSGWVFDPAELWIVGAALMVSWVGAALPAWRVHAVAVPDVLKTA